MKAVPFDGNEWIPEFAVKIARCEMDVPCGIYIGGESYELSVRHAVVLSDRIGDLLKKNDIAYLRADIRDEEDLLNYVTNLDPLVRVVLFYDCGRAVNHSTAYLASTVEMILQHLRLFNVIPVFCDRNYSFSARFRGSLFDHCFASISVDGITDGGKPECSARVRVRLDEWRYFIDPTTAVYENGIFHSPLPRKVLNKAHDCGIHEKADYIGQIISEERWKRYEPDKNEFVAHAEMARRQIQRYR